MKPLLVGGGTETPPRSLARLAGIFQVLEAVTSAFGQVVVPGRLVVFGNAAATAANILGHERLFWLGYASGLVGVVFHIVWAVLVYDLLKTVNRRIALLATFVILVGCAIATLASLLYLAPWLVLHGGKSLSAFTVEQLQALALTFLKLNAYAYDMYLVFFGLWCILVGFLIFRSKFLPRVVGILLAVAGMGWMTFLSPPLGIRLFPLIAIASGLGEIPLFLWLLVAGVNDERWKEQASAAGVRNSL